MKGIIVDDDATIRLLLDKYCSTQDNLEIIQEFDNGVEAINFLKNNTVDFMFLDIHMPFITGVEIVKSIKNPPNIIMVTSDDKFAVDAFQHETIIDYILKPLTYSRFLITVDKLKNLNTKNNTNKPDDAQKADNLFVSSNGKMIKIFFNNIKFLKANSDYVNIYTKEKTHIIHSTFKNIKENIPDDLFFQVHRSYIVNLKNISEIEDNTIIIDRNVIPVSKTYRTELYKRLNML